VARERRLRDRSTGDLLVLLLAGTICLSVLAAGATIAVLQIQGDDTSRAAGLLSDVVNTLIGLLAGFLAGRTETARVGPGP
jgi:hypothetical protein